VQWTISVLLTAFGLKKFVEYIGCPIKNLAETTQTGLTAKMPPRMCLCASGGHFYKLAA
jgi:hypothetical protein